MILVLWERRFRREGAVPIGRGVAIAPEGHGKRPRPEGVTSLRFVSMEGLAKVLTQTDGQTAGLSLPGVEYLASSFQLMNLSRFACLIT